MSKKILIITIIIVVVGVILFSVKSGGDNTVTEDGVIASSSNSSVGSDFVKALLGVNTISLDVSLFNSPVFNSLDASGAYVDPNPEKGRVDPFSKIGKDTVSSEAISVDQVSRATNLGVNSVSGAEIIVSRLTSTTATVSIRGLAENEKVSAILLGSNDSLVTVPNFVYKSETKEYVSTITGLISKITYTVRIQTPENSAGLQADFTTK